MSIRTRSNNIASASVRTFPLKLALGATAAALVIITPVLLHGMREQKGVKNGQEADNYRWIAMTTFVLGFVFAGISNATAADFSGIVSYKGLGTLLSVLAILGSGLSSMFATLPVGGGADVAVKATYIIGFITFGLMTGLRRSGNTARSYFGNPALWGGLLGVLFILVAQFYILPMDRESKVTDGLGQPVLVGGWAILVLSMATGYATRGSGGRGIANYSLS